MRLTSFVISACVIFCLLASPALALPRTTIVAPQHSRNITGKRLRVAAGSSSRPWKARVRRHRYGFVRGYALVNPHAMPKEPTSPDVKKLDAFANGLRILQPNLGKKRALRYARWITSYADLFAVDPFVVASYIHVQSAFSTRYHASPRKKKASSKKERGYGIARLRPSVHARFIRQGRYRYWVFENAWQQRELVVDRFKLTRKSLRSPEASIYFACALLSIYGAQDRSLHLSFPQRDHRHPVAHLYWGDRVRGNQIEDRVLRDRRRLIEYYNGRQRTPSGRYKGMALHLPLDGAPRKITSGFYARRGRRMHRALDFYSHTGEPVRAIADGVVYFAGYQRRGHRSRPIHPSLSKYARRWRLGIGGLFVLIRHKNGLSSGYFHLHEFTVRSRQRVKAGQLIGYVGGTGFKNSRPHLHFQLRKNKRLVNPVKYFGKDILPLTSTYFGQYSKARAKRRYNRRIKRAKARRARAKARRARAKARRARASKRSRHHRKRSSRLERSKRSKRRHYKGPKRRSSKRSSKRKRRRQ
jgi:murein DD-endopeptidase MepM/ murein hydrolase activator NlpD